VAERSAKNGNIHNFGQALWWAVMTVTTVSYGDHSPTTAFGLGVAVVLMLVRIGLIAC
jgi:voltage-gated potassium channel